MKIVKMFDFYKDGIRDALAKTGTDIDFYDCESIQNDIAIEWYVVSEEEEDGYNDYHAVVDKVLREAGCKADEKVFIWISW